MKSNTMRFSGHETFHCKEQWLLKGVQLLQKQTDKSFINSDNAIYELGVGNNMVRSIQYWLRSFSLINDDNEFTNYSEYIFLDKGYDPYLENSSTLYILQYLLLSNKYASIYSLIFSEYFKDKSNLEFSEVQIIKFCKRILAENQIVRISEKTIKADFKVFIRTYVTPIKNIKTIEDDFSTPLIGLKLISDTGKKNDLNQPIYKINKQLRKDLSEYTLAFCILDYFDGQQAIDFVDILSTIGTFLCLNNEGLEEILDRLCRNNNNFIYKSDAGVNQLQVKRNDKQFKNEILKYIYV